MIFRFGPFELDERAGELRERGEPVAVQPKPLALLALLLRERERVVPNEELLERLWPGTAVTPGSLSRAVSHARRAIGDTHRGEVLRSFPRRGYRFVADVVAIDPKAPSAAAPVPAADRAGNPFVGRGDALGRLRAAWERAEGGRGAIALVSGPAGIGKTRLGEVFSAELEARGVVPWVARGRDGDGVPAFWLWAQVIRQLVDDPLFEDEARELARHGRELQSLVPQLARFEAPGAAPAAELSAEQSRFLLFDAVARALVAASRKRPVLILLEDLHWARSASLRLLEHLCFEIGAERICVVASVRDGRRERGDPVDRSLAVLRQHEGFDAIALGGFSRGEVGRLLEQVLGRPGPSDLISELYARTEGVPLFLHEAIRVLSERGDLAEPERIARQGITLPTRTIDFIQRALEGLAPEVAELVGAGAVIGREFSLPFAANIAQEDRGAALDAIDEGIRAGVLEEVPDSPASVRFVHALFQEASYDGLSPGTRARLHYRAARLLEKQHGDDPLPVIAAIADHYHKGIAMGDAERALACARLAARHARAVCAYEQAADHHEQALDALGHHEAVEPGERLATLLELGEAQQLAGDRARRREVLTQALELARSLERPKDFARAAIGFCDLSEWSPRDELADERLREALEQLPAAGEEGAALAQRARLQARVGYLAYQNSRRSAESDAREASVLARASGDPLAIQEALYTLHYVISGPDDLDERAALIGEIVEAAGSSGNPDTALIAVLDVASDRLALGDGAGARALRERARVMAGDSPLPGMAWHIQVYDAGVALLEGRFADCARMSEAALQLGRRIEHPYAYGCWNGHEALLRRERGDHEGALERMAPAVNTRKGPIHWVRAFVARSQLALGREDEARDLFESIAKADFSEVPRAIRWTNSMVEAALLCAELDDAERARSLCEILAPVEGQHGLLAIPINYGGPVTRCLARLHEVLGRVDEADQLFADARASCETLGARPMQARIELEWGTMLVRGRGADRERGSALLEAARATAAELGMPEVVAGAEAARA